jgi:adenine phosphoribosyltransferase
MLEQQIKAAIRDVPDFPKEGIIFKDITPIFLDATLSKSITNAFVEHARTLNIDVVCGLESRGFLFGVGVAQALNVPFVLLRKKGKLPRATVEESYDLEYGQATIEVHREDIPKGSRVLIHDDLLATGGTAVAAAKLIQKLDAKVTGFSFLIELSFLSGSEKIRPYSRDFKSLVSY